MIHLPASTVVQALGFALVSYLWQGVLAAGLLLVSTAVLGRRSAEIRYGLACGALLLMLAAPTFTFLRALRVGEAPPLPTFGDGLIPVEAPLLSVVKAETQAPRLVRDLPWLVSFWAAGVLLLSLRSIGGFVLTQRLKRSGTALQALEETVSRLSRALRVSRPVRLCESALVAVPTVVGGLRPVILLPLSAATGLSVEQLELILAHELAHVRRCDYWVNLAQTGVETLLFYHPATWWVSHRIRIERENCCDDLTVATCGEPLLYARALADLEQLRQGTPAFAMAATGGSLLDRVRRIVGEPPTRSFGLPVLLLTAAAALAGASLLARPAEKQAAPSAAPQPEAPGVAPAPVAPRERIDAPRVRKPAEAVEKRAFPLEKVLELARSGVTPEWVDEMSEAGYPKLSLDELMALRHQGVGPEYVKGMAALGYSHLSPIELISLRQQGVGPEYVSELKTAGIHDVSIQELIDLRSQGVGGRFAKEMSALGYTLSPMELIELRQQGVSATFVTEMKDLGYEQISPSRLMALRSEGVTAAFVREMKEVGVADLSIPVLIGLRQQGVTPAFVREMQGAGLKGLNVSDLLSLRHQGVTGRFAREMSEVGYGGLSESDLISLVHAGVGAEFVRELQHAGLTGLSVSELIELRSKGVRGSLLERLKGRQ
jgi:beta-lactamase regulating signal transducer with metallopeptidase domain